jgi:hypothetical protein
MTTRKSTKTAAPATPPVSPAADTWDAWEQGYATDQEAANVLARDLAEVEDQIAPLDRERKALRLQLERIVRRAGAPIKVQGIGELVTVDATHGTTYDPACLDSLIAALVGEGQLELAQRISLCRKEASRAGYLLVRRAK